MEVLSLPSGIGTHKGDKMKVPIIKDAKSYREGVAWDNLGSTKINEHVLAKF